MEDKDIKQLWASLNEKVEQNIALTQKLVENTTELKIKTLLNSMRPLKMASVLVGLLWVVLLDFLLLHLWGISNIFFKTSLLFLIIVNKLAIGIYLYQLILIWKVDISQPIIKTQEKLAQLQVSTIWVARILFLQLPAWSTFYLHAGMFVAHNALPLIFQVVITLLLTICSVWLFLNIHTKNKDKKWFKRLFDGQEWTPVIKSMTLIDELKEFKK
jgi:hypothetical protein